MRQIEIDSYLNKVYLPVSEHYIFRQIPVRKYAISAE